ncbi:protein OBERON 3 [Andrographis paniculata]|uniref:protein OBERON 3 n=1 Tax=Andrographis paniculata TaxID=175694 RepID=UPI0021E7ABA1|nr:protein OBERON 3 [Andrographis paniculata]
MSREREKSDDLSGDRARESPDGKGKFQERGIDFLGENSSDLVKKLGSESEQASCRAANLGSQELTLSYLCENSKLGFQEKDPSGQNLLNSLDKVSGRYKGKEIVVSEDQNEEDNKVWVERDFLRLNENRGNSSKREAENAEAEEDNREKKPKVESLNLSLALPDVSLSLAGSNRVQINGDLPSRLRPSRSVQSLGPSYNNTMTTYSNDFTAASLSYSYSHQFSHNPSCSLTRNSTENYEYSVGSHRRDCDHIWNCGEGTNGSVHSRFRPVGDGTVALANPGGVGGLAMGNRGGLNKDSGNNSLYRTTSSENLSFFPSELPARPRLDAQSGDSRRRNLENAREMEEIDVARPHKITTPERIVREVVLESIPVMAQIIQELTDETIQSAKEYLNAVIASPERKDELLSLQRRLERRSDLTNETLSKCQKSQLEILVAVKMGLGSFLSSKNKLPASELVDIFLLERCQNINCRRLLPVDDCDCKICSTKKGFCSECMCPVCFNFDCASHTCSWVGCDACSHWCHTACGLKRNLIKPGPCLKGSSGATEMQFHCLACGHDSEMFGFVKAVFTTFAKDWSLETLVKELDCVRKVFAGSEDRKGKELYAKANEMIAKLQNKMITPAETCNSIFQFFDSSDGLFEMGSSSTPSTGLTDQVGFRREAPALLLSNSTPKPSFHNLNSSTVQRDSTLFDHIQNQPKALPITNGNDKVIEDEWSVKPSKKDGFDSLESLVRIKEAEARMFQSRADEARREIDNFRRMIRVQTDKLEEEYSEKLAKLCLQETEERRRKKLDALKALENSHCDYYKMKIRMQSEISGLLKRMEATKQQLV